MSNETPRSRSARLRRRVLPAIVSAALAIGVGAVAATPAQAAGERVDSWLTTSSGEKGTTVVRGLEQQPALSFTSGTASGGTTISVNPSNEMQVFEGGGASITGSTAHLFQNVLSSGTRADVMKKLFSPTEGIGLSFIRNPIGVSDLSPDPKDDVTGTMDDTCCTLDDFGAQNNNDDTVRALTKQAQDLNSAVRVMVVPWTAPAWMKSNNKLDDQGWLKWEYAPMYAQYLVKYIQRYQQAGIEVEYVSVSNEPNCKCGNPGMEWNSDGMARFVRDNVYPAFRAAGIKTKVLIHDWNYANFEDLNRQSLDDAAIRNDALFGGVAWHGYTPESTSKGTEVHNQYPNVMQFSTEHSGGTWVPNQHNEDLTDIVSYARNWSSSLVKWGLALDQNHHPYNPIWSTGANNGAGALTGCDVCTGLVTVHDGDSRSGQVDYTIEYYTTGHLTKFVKPGAHRVESTNTSGVINVAYKNTDGSVALIAHNPGDSAQTVNINWSGQKATASLPAHTTATYVWKAGVTGGGGGTGASTVQLKHDVTNGRCVDVTGGATANGTPLQLWDCDANNTNQKFTFASDGSLKWKDKCVGIAGGNASNGADVVTSNCDGSANQKWTRNGDGTVKSGNVCFDVRDGTEANGTRIQVWSCTAGPNQKWRT